MAALFQVLGERFQHPLERAVTYPALEPAMAGLVRRIPLGQVRPLGARPQNPEDAIEYLATAAPGPPASIHPPWHLANERFQHLPLFVCQIHRDCILLEDTAYHSFMR